MFTIYDDSTNQYDEVEEPDASYEYSYADYLQWKFEERVELIRGRIMKMTAPNRKHQDISRDISLKLGFFLKNKKCKMYAAPFDVRLPRKNNLKDEDIITVVQPDLCVICDERKLDDKGCIGAPDLVIEILSPGNSKREVRLKYELYEEAGVKEYWIINPVEENIAVFTINDHGAFDGAKLYAADDTIDSKAIDGFQISVSDIFQTN